MRHLGDPGAVARDVCAGLEEEGVPVVVEGAVVESAVAEGGRSGEEATGDGGNAVSLAFAAAQASSLGVGIGIATGVAGNAVCVHHAKRPAARPVLTADPTQARWCGHNAARLVVGLPFKQQPGTTRERMEESWPHS
ncbi:hypothetical protein BJF85_20315 [Saccharomonospora sp. CUA-673]|nr:hypothetical protein BJF85_20315 [Saccharomonospora sp. CUA-673]